MNPERVFDCALARTLVLARLDYLKQLRAVHNQRGQRIPAATIGTQVGEAAEILALLTQLDREGEVVVGAERFYNPVREP